MLVEKQIAMRMTQQLVKQLMILVFIGQQESKIKFNHTAIVNVKDKEAVNDKDIKK